MASPHFCVQIIGRGNGKNVVNSVAYRAQERLQQTSMLGAMAYRSGQAMEANDNTDGPAGGKIFDYTHKSGIIHSEILTPNNAPEWMKDRARLWSAVEEKEKRKDAQLARDFVIALPRELDREQQKALALRFAQKHLVAHGMIADVNIHDSRARDGGRNPHAHITVTMRQITAEGFGNKVRQWNSPQTVAYWRHRWEMMANEALESAGSTERLSLASYKTRGMDKEATIPLGVKASALEKRGIATDAGNLNREIQRRNAQKEIARKRAEAKERRATRKTRNYRDKSHYRRNETREYPASSPEQAERRPWRDTAVSSRGKTKYRYNYPGTSYRQAYRDAMKAARTKDMQRQLQERWEHKEQERAERVTLQPAHKPGWMSKVFNFWKKDARSETPPKEESRQPMQPQDTRSFYERDYEQQQLRKAAQMRREVASISARLHRSGVTQGHTPDATRPAQTPTRTQHRARSRSLGGHYATEQRHNPRYGTNHQPRFMDDHQAQRAGTITVKSLRQGMQRAEQVAQAVKKAQQHNATLSKAPQQAAAKAAAPTPAQNSGKSRLWGKAAQTQQSQNWQSKTQTKNDKDRIR